jgi:hypothetical protein
MSFGVARDDIDASSSDRRHNAQLLRDLLKRRSFWESLQSVKRSLLVCHGKRLRLLRSLSKLREAAVAPFIAAGIFQSMKAEQQKRSPTTAAG